MKPKKDKVYSLKGNKNNENNNGKKKKKLGKIEK